MESSAGARLLRRAGTGACHRTSPVARREVLERLHQGETWVAAAADQLVVHPLVRLLEAILKRDRRLPPQDLLDAGVVTIPTAHALRSTEIVDTLQLDAGDVLNDVDELVDTDEPAAAQIEGVSIAALHDAERAVHAVIDIHEAPRLLAIAPDLNLMFTGHLRRSEE